MGGSVNGRVKYYIYELEVNYFKGVMVVFKTIFLSL